MQEDAEDKRSEDCRREFHSHVHDYVHLYFDDDNSYVDVVRLHHDNVGRDYDNSHVDVVRLHHDHLGRDYVHLSFDDDNSCADAKRGVLDGLQYSGLDAGRRSRPCSYY
jgi:hypothetical protein